MSENKVTKSIKTAAGAFISTWALQRIFSVGPGNILTVILFILIMFMYMGQGRSTDRRINICSAVIAAIFSILYSAYDLQSVTKDLKSGIFRVIIIMVTLAGLYILFARILTMLYRYICDGSIHRAVFLDDGTVYTDRLFPVVAVICLICMIPCFLYEYPGVMTPDSINQLKQVIGAAKFSNHHPFVHTMLIALFFRPAYAVTHSMTEAVGCYTFAQMCMMSLSAAYCVNTMRRLHARKWVLIAATVFFAAVPYNWVYAVSVWKDVLFAASVLLYAASLLRIFYLSEKTAYAAQLAACLGMMLLRSNGWFMFIGLMPFMAAWCIRNRRSKAVLRLAAVWLGAFIIAVLVKYPLFSALGVEQPDLIESCSIPAQQIAYVLTEESDIPEKDMQLIRKTVDTEYIGKLYAPGFADNIKELVRAGDEDYLAEHKGEFLKLWIRLGMRYPGDYLKAYKDMTYGYWFPDRTYDVADNEGISGNELGLTGQPMIPAQKFLKLQEIQIKLGNMLPLYSVLWSMGTLVWICAAGLGGLLVQRRFRDILLILPGFTGLFTVLIATPVAYDFRYLYFLVYSIPLYIVIFSGIPDGNAHSSSMLSM